MKTTLKKFDFDFDYTGSSYKEETAIKKGYKQLNNIELHKTIVNKTVFGEYPGGYKFISEIYENGKTEGINDVGSQDFGNWSIDIENNTLHLEWKKGWINTVTRAYQVNDTIEFYDIKTGNWRTTFKKIKNL